MKKPKDIEKYVSRDDALQFLLGLTFRILQRPSTERVKVSAQFSIWDDAWLEKATPKPPFILSNMRVAPRSSVLNNPMDEPATPKRRKRK